MRTVLHLISVALVAHASAQLPYRPFPEGDAVWIEYHDGIIGSGCMSGNIWAYFHRAIFFGGDEEHNGHTYHRLMRVDDGTQWCPGPPPWWEAPYHLDVTTYIAFRQDTAERKVYCWEDGSNEEKILFDFSGDVGDTIPSGYGQAIIDSIFMMPLPDGEHRTFVLRDMGGNFPDLTSNLIEGVGLTSFYTPFWELGAPFEYGGSLECFTQNGTSIFTDTIDGPPICDITIVMSVPPDGSGAGPLSIHPNPALLAITVDGEEHRDARYTMVSAVGTSVQQGIIADRTIDIARLPTGVYTLVVANANGQRVAHARFVKE